MMKGLSKHSCNRRQRCADCFNSCSIISENGVHYNCGLPENEAVDCLCGRVDHYDSFARMRKERAQNSELSDSMK